MYNQYLGYKVKHVIYMIPLQSKVTPYKNILINSSVKLEEILEVAIRILKEGSWTEGNMDEFRLCR